VSLEDQIALMPGDAVEFEDAYTGETKYGRVENGHGSTFILHIISRQEAGLNPKSLKVRKPCSKVMQPDGTRICGSHRVELLSSEVRGESNPPGLANIKAWTCPVSQKQFLEAEGF